MMLFFSFCYKVLCAFSICAIISLRKVASLSVCLFVYVSVIYLWYYDTTYMFWRYLSIDDL